MHANFDKEQRNERSMQIAAAPAFATMPAIALSKRM
jgi:hypothetical protein